MTEHTYAHTHIRTFKKTSTYTIFLGEKCCVVPLDCVEEFSHAIIAAQLTHFVFVMCSACFRFRFQFGFGFAATVADVPLNLLSVQQEENPTTEFSCMMFFWWIFSACELKACGFLLCFFKFCYHQFQVNLSGHEYLTCLVYKFEHLYFIYLYYDRQCLCLSLLHPLFVYATFALRSLLRESCRVKLSNRYRFS